MKTKGLVERVRHDGDQRTMRIRLTERARSTIDSLFADHIANEASLLAILGQRRALSLGNELKVVLEALGDPRPLPRPRQRA